ncbi:MAG TPA: hypothetical protein VHH92_04260 [Actinomycetota bacterium]|nr:hypothetical protein [Actinomycetota bacterium]
MDWLQIVLRVVHIAAGIFWVGAATFLLVFVEPTMHALGPQGGPFMRHMTAVRKMPTVIAVSAVLTIVAGIWLYWRDTGGFEPDVIATGPGIGFGVGGLAAILAFVLGLTLVRPRVERMGALAGAMASGSPSPEQAQEMAALQRKLRSISVFNQVLLVIAVIAMATARYL